MAPNDRSTWQDTGGTRVWVDLWSSDRPSSFEVSSISKYPCSFVSGKWTFASWTLLQRAAKVCQSNVDFFSGLGCPVWRFASTPTDIHQRASFEDTASFASWLFSSSHGMWNLWFLPCHVALPIDVALLAKQGGPKLQVFFAAAGHLTNLGRR